MMIAEVGSSANVIGTSTAVPAEGPKPGNTPTMVPSMHPANANPRFVGVSAIANPPNRRSKLSISGSRSCGSVRIHPIPYHCGMIPLGSGILSKFWNT